MRINKLNLIYIGIFCVLLVYFFHSFGTVYPLLIGGNLFVCDSCSSHILAFIQKTLSILAFIALGNVLISYFKTFNFKRSLDPVNPQPKLINEMEKEYALQSKIIVFNDYRPMAFCLGVIVPKIYLSSQIFKKMTPSEIRTIVLHEKQHIVGRDNFLFFILNLFKTAFFFFPVIGDMVESVEIQKEIIADRAVVRKTGNNIDIISALKKVIMSKPDLFNTATFSESHSLEPRIRALVGKKGTPSTLKYRNIIISLSVLLFLINITLSRVEIHPQSNSLKMLCLDKGTCQNTCQ